MIESGSHVPGITGDMFGLPPHTALRYERPDDRLGPHLTSYVVLDSDPVAARDSHEWMLPSWAQIWIIMTEAPIAVTIGNRRYDPMPAAALYGVTSRAMPVRANGGVTIGIDISPLGWARLFDAPAEALRDRVTPLQNAMAPRLIEDLVRRLRASDQALDVKPVLDDFFLAHMATPHPAEADIRRLMAIVNDPDVTDAAMAADAMGMSSAAIRRLSKRFFGFPVKTLLMRARFTRNLLAMMTSKDRCGHLSGAPVTGYHDASHFIRDGRRFLGMTPRQFAALPTPYLDAALRARRLVMGSSTPAIDRPPAAPALSAMVRSEVHAGA